MSHSRFVWFDLNTTDIDAARAFYTDVVGWGTESWQPSPEAPPYLMFTAGGNAIGGFRALPDAAKAMGAPPHFLAYVSCADVDATTAKAAALGATTLMAPMDIPTVGRFSVIRDPWGAVIAPFTPANPMTDDGVGPGLVAWRELMTDDLEGAVGFYADLFGWVETGSMDMGPAGRYPMFGGDAEQMLGGMMTRPVEMPMSAWLYYFNVPDLGAAIARAKAAGGQLVSGPMEVPGGDHVAELRDPQGASFALHELAKG
ncbi:MAG: putative enzyme related to lactoylglutathione lyase [Myxococcota bacterium]|jgi:predicted enzyme related to lactoylglutathione lyase